MTDPYYSAVRDLERLHALGHWREYPLETLQRLVRTLERAEAKVMAQERKRAAAARVARRVKPLDTTASL